MTVLVTRASSDSRSCSGVNLSIDVLLLALLDLLGLGRRRIVVAAGDLVVRGDALFVRSAVDPASVENVARVVASQSNLSAHGDVHSLS